MTGVLKNLYKKKKIMLPFFTNAHIHYTFFHTHIHNHNTYDKV